MSESVKVGNDSFHNESQEFIANNHHTSTSENTRIHYAIQYQKDAEVTNMVKSLFDQMRDDHRAEMELMTQKLMKME